ncbi:MAG: hypothetical protein EPO26_09740 [Chloroflexota bacterium]|nr:MAG: hypothetical protein EPO26_09740 [Chloroflexota bacterium]
MNAELIPSILSVSGDDLSRLGPDEAVDVIRELLWAEATRLGIGRTHINVPSAITVSDGGVDAEVRDAPTEGSSRTIKSGLTRYQIKTGRYSPYKRANVDKLLLTPRSLRQARELKPRIKSCLDHNGTLVIVLFGWDDPDTDEEASALVRRTLADVDMKYAAASVEVWRQNTIRGLIETFPSLALRLSGNGGARFQTHGSWTRNDDMTPKLVTGESQVQTIDDIRGELRRGDGFVHVRLFGEPGVGKTRLILEVLRPDDLRPLVVYCDAATTFIDSNLLNELLRESSSHAAILVIDECDQEQRSRIWNKLKFASPRLKLVTIHTDPDGASGETRFFEAPLLTAQEIARIIEGYGVVPYQAQRWAELCGGSPRFAHMIGLNLRDYPDDLLRTPDTANVFLRCIAAGQPIDSPEVQQRTLVLQHLALFKKVGYRQPYDAEARAVAALVAGVDPTITWPRFVSIVESLRRRRLLRGESTLYLTPKALHIWLWAQWWDKYGPAFDFERFSEQLSPRLVEWFNEMIVYARQSAEASRSVRDLLGPDGPFVQGDYLKRTQTAHLFFSLTQADPEAALRVLERTLARWDDAELREFTGGRANMVWALECIAVWRPLFPSAARLLARLAETEGELQLNHASQIFASLFAVSEWPAAATEASPEERFPVLQEMLASASPTRRRLAVGSLDHVLETSGQVRIGTAEQQGLRTEARLWQPATYWELYAAYRAAWDMLAQARGRVPAEEWADVLKIMTGQVRGLSRYHALAPMVLETLEAVADDPTSDRALLIETAHSLLRHEGQHLPEELRTRWSAFEERLIGHDFPSLLRRYVRMQLIEDLRGNDEGGGVNWQTQVDQLAANAVRQPELLTPEFDWLLAESIPNGTYFGYALGVRDESVMLLPLLVSGLKSRLFDRSAFVLGGYFRAVFERDGDRWERELDALAADEQLAVLVPIITCRSGLTERAVARVLTLAHRGIASVEDLRMFNFGGIPKSFTDRDAIEWLGSLRKNGDKVALAAALEFAAHRLHSPEPRETPPDLLLDLVMQDVLFQTDKSGRGIDLAFDWARVARALVDARPEYSLALARKLIEHFANDGAVSEKRSEAIPILEGALEEHPAEVWPMLALALGPPIDSRAWHLRMWLRGGFRHVENGGPAPLEHVPTELLWRWVDENTDQRAPYIATIVPPILHHETGRRCLARDVLIRYGNGEDVRRALMANFGTETWWGPESEHFRAKRESLLEFARQESEPAVRRWIDEYVVGLAFEVERARREEEREL